MANSEVGLNNFADIVLRTNEIMRAQENCTIERNYVMHCEKKKQG
jgi:hypothetical protein